MDQFILLGDSITQHAYSLDQDRGYLGPALSSAYVRKLDIVNRGFSGYNTRQALKLLPHIIPSPDQVTLRFLTIWFGANDARLPHTPGGPDQHVPIKEFKENLRAIATHECVRAHEDVRIILITPPPVEERKLIEADGSLRRTAHITATYARQVIELGKELNVPVINLWEQLVVRAGWSTKLVDETAFPGSEKAAKNDVLRDFLLDGLHLSRSGYKVLYDELLRTINDNWPDQMPANLPFVFPAWDDSSAWRREQGVGRSANI